MGRRTVEIVLVICHCVPHFSEAVSSILDELSAAAQKSSGLTDKLHLYGEQELPTKKIEGWTSLSLLRGDVCHHVPVATT